MSNAFGGFKPTNKVCMENVLCQWTSPLFPRPSALFIHASVRQEGVPYPAPPPPCIQCLGELSRLMQELPVRSPGGGLCGCIAVYVTCPLLGVSGDKSGMVSPDLQPVESVLIFCCDGGKRTEIEVPRGWDSSFCPLKTMWPQPRQYRWISVSSSGKCG